MTRTILFLLAMLPFAASAQYNPLETTDQARQRQSVQRHDVYRDRGDQVPLGGYSERLGDPAPRGTASPGYVQPAPSRNSLPSDSYSAPTRSGGFDAYGRDAAEAARGRKPY